MYPRTVSEIYHDFTQRRAGLLRALTDDFEDLFQQCDPNKDNLCLYGERNGTWSVDLPAEEVPPELPEPCLGVNFARDGMTRRDWVSLLAVHSDAWLLSVAFFYAVKLDVSGRASLFRLISQHPTLFEVVSGRAGKDDGPPVAAPAQQQPGKQPGGLLVGGTTAVAVSSRQPRPTGRRLQQADINPALRGMQAELYWPDDELWYLVEIAGVNMTNKSAKIVYTTGEQEDLDLEEIVRDGHMSLLL